MKKITLAATIFLLLFFEAAMPALAEETENTEEKYLRGVWVSSVYNLDFPSEKGLGEYSLKKELDSIVDNCADLGMNAIFFQVRPCADALYKSEIFPVSVFLSGTSSYSLDFDPLEYIIKKAHEKNIELHAWINPYRAALSESGYAALDSASPQKQHPEYLLKAADGSYFFNPALSEVRRLILDGIEEIIDNYDVDGIHFDDYFYPDSAYDDSADFASLGAGFGSVEEWRINNVNLLVSQAHDLIKGKNKAIAFGISPRGIWANNTDDYRGSATRGGGSLTQIYCDSLRFIKEGWVDYICPQLYWSIGYETADYKVLTAWWASAVSGSEVKLYIGMGDYRTENAPEGSVWSGAEELRRQLNLNKAYPAVKGEIHFRYGSIVQNPSLTALYKEEAPAGDGEARPDKTRLKGTLWEIVKALVLGER